MINEGHTIKTKSMVTIQNNKQICRKKTKKKSEKNEINTRRRKPQTTKTKKKGEEKDKTPKKKGESTQKYFAVTGRDITLLQKFPRRLYNQVIASEPRRLQESCPLCLYFYRYYHPCLFLFHLDI